ncbi:hypothetical protein ACHAWF_006844 [Thalassiosira exigua]
MRRPSDSHWGISPPRGPLPPPRTRRRRRDCERRPSPSSFRSSARNLLGRGQTKQRGEIPQPGGEGRHRRSVCADFVRRNGGFARQIVAYRVRGMRRLAIVENWRPAGGILGQGIVAVYDRIIGGRLTADGAEGATRELRALQANRRTDPRTAALPKIEIEYDAAAALAGARFHPPAAPPEIENDFALRDKRRRYLGLWGGCERRHRLGVLPKPKPFCTSPYNLGTMPGAPKHRKWSAGSRQRVAVADYVACASRIKCAAAA